MPVCAAATNKSVCLQRNAGIWIISTTSLTALACSGRWISVVTGMLKLFFISSKIFNPASKPSPLNDEIDVLLALSKELLKTNGIFSLDVISVIFSAMPKQWSLLSITHGPPMKGIALSPKIMLSSLLCSYLILAIL